jgi:hypothetical protein
VGDRIHKVLHVFHVVQQELQRILAMFCGTGHVHQAGRVQSGQLLEGAEQSQHALSAGLLLHPEERAGHGRVIVVVKRKNNR